MHEILRQLACAQGGVVSRKQAANAGVPASQLGTPFRPRELVRIGPDAYVDVEELSSLSRTRRLALQVAAARLRSDVDFVAVGATAALIHDLPLLGPTPIRLQLAERREARPVHHGQSRTIDDDDVVTVHGVPLSSLARTAVDVARRRPFAAGVVSADAVLARGVPRVRLQEVLERSKRWPGLAIATRVVEFADGRSESPLESLGRVRFFEHGLPPPELQVVLSGLGGEPARVDQYWGQYRTVAEADGAAKYVDRVALFEEKQREDRMRDAGFEVVRYTWDEALGRPAVIVGRLVRAFRRGTRRAA